MSFSYFILSFCGGLIDFKQINDTYGHFAGDEVLQGFVELAVSSLREYDILGRMGGDEFLVVAPVCDPQQAKNLLERVYAQFQKKHIETKAGEILLGISVGVSWTNGDLTAEEIISIADKALYKAKELGKNRVVLI